MSKTKKEETKEEVLEEKDQVVEEQEGESNGPTEQEEEQEEISDLETAQLEATKAKDKYLRLYSEFENFRRRTAKEKNDLISTAGRSVIESLLPVLDDFDRAKLSAEDEKASLESVREGLDLIQQKMNNLLGAKGLKKMEIKQGDKFDDEFHEAITQIPADKKLEGKIVDVVEPGYFLGETVIRFAKVVTGAKQ